MLTWVLNFLQMFAKYLQANENMLRIIAHFSGAEDWINI